ncbi:MAG TPA: hypothetical protein VF891_05100 [Gaiellaceae bacterium]
MELTSRETWTLIHGLILGSLFLLAFAGGLAGLYSFRTELVTAVGIRERLFRLRVGVTGMAVLAWATVITGTWVVYPWYRETIAGKSLAACGGLQAPNSKCSPKEFLLSNTSGDTSDWHEFGMEWKEHIAWMAPMLATAAALLVLYYGRNLVADRRLRMIVLVLFVGAFATAAVAGLFGALITKAAPVR